MSNEPTTHRAHLTELGVDLLVTTYSDGTITASVREDAWSTWGVEVPLTGRLASAVAS